MTAPLLKGLFLPGPISSASDYDPFIGLATFFLCLLVFYTVDVFRVDIWGSAAWGLLLVVAATIAATSTLILTATIHAVMAGAYLAGLYLETGQFASPYLRTILTGFIISTFVLAMLGTNARRPGPSLISARAQVVIHRLALVGIAVWSIYAVQHLVYYGEPDFRAVTGGNYLTISDVLALFCLSMQLRRGMGLPERIVSAIVCLSALLLFGSRPSILLTSAILAILIARELRLRMSLLAIVAVLAGLAAAVYALGRQTMLLSRIATVLDPLNDSSLLVRLKLFDELFQHLAHNPRCLIVACPPEVGRYAHNILSVIQDFGIVGIAFCAAYLGAISLGLRRILRSEAWPLYVYSFVMVGLFRAWTHIVFAVCLALLIVLAESAMRSARPIKRGSAQ